MGCCLFASILAGAPRLGFLILWLFQPVRVSTAFQGWVIPLFGFLFFPWTTLMWLIVAPLGVVSGFGWLWLGLAFVLDISTYTGGGYANKRRSS